MPRPKVVVLDYGSGNLRSAQRALERAGAAAQISAELDAALEADGLLVPGVGAFGACVRAVRDCGADRIIAERASAGRPVLGICVGMQILFDRGEEGDAGGLGLMPGIVARLEAQVLPHLGWNEVRAHPRSALLAGLDGERFYFVHSFAVRSVSSESARVSWCDYGGAFAAAVEDGALAGTQFHPEKSGDAGAAMLASWAQSLR